MYQQRDMMNDCVPKGKAVQVKNTVFFDCHLKGDCIFKSNLLNKDRIPTCGQSLLGGIYGPDSAKKENEKKD